MSVKLHCSLIARMFDVLNEYPDEALMKHVPATTQTVVSHAYRLGDNDAERHVALWAGSQLMALYGSRANIYQEHADIWAEKLEPRAPLSAAKK